MKTLSRFGTVALPLLFCVFSAQGLAQDPAAQQAPASPPPAVPPAKDPYILEDGGLYFQPFYWLNKAQPDLKGGKAATAYSNYQFTGNAKAGLGGEIGIPAGRSNTLRITYFRVTGNTTTTLARDTTLYSVAYNAGDLINSNYKLQGAKVSWDYLSYTWHKPSTDIHVKTLYEVQYVNSGVNADAPYKVATGTTTSYAASGSRSAVLPTFGMALGSQFGKVFRWDIRGSGFGLPHRPVIAGAEATVAVRVRAIEIVGGGKFLYFKTSPAKDIYLTDMLSGVFGGIRFVWSGNLTKQKP